MPSDSTEETRRKLRHAIVVEHNRLWNDDEIGPASHSEITLRAGEAQR